MKHRKYILLPIFVLTLAILACSSVPNVNLNIGQRVEGSGTIITETRNVSGFNRVSLSGFGHVEISQGESESLTVSTDDNIMSLIETKVKGNTLVLGFTNEGNRKSINPSDGIKFDLVVKDLERIDISGAGDIHAEQLVVENLKVDLSGAGSLEFDSVIADELVTNVSGAGSVIIAGQVKGQEINHSGVGSYHAADLESDTAIVNMSGAGSATLWVKETLDVKVSGLGNIIYYGTPRVVQNVSGLGKLVGQGEK